MSFSSDCLSMFSKKTRKKNGVLKKWFFAAGIFLGSVAVFILALLIFFNLPGQTIRQDVLAGITFSYRQAESLGLDWKKTYIALLDEMKVREIRVPVYWNDVEREEGKYDFSNVDWQLEEAKKRGAHIILTVGQRVPRWPECHIPEWSGNDDEKRKKTLLAFVEETVKRYKDRSEVETWQVENEAFLPFFGKCPELDVAVLDREIALVRSIDPSRPVLMSDSGELSIWVQAARRGDIFGTTMYRDVYKPGIGYYRYPIGPNFFIFKEWIVRLFTKQEHFYVVELQAEPWGPGWVGDLSLEEQFKTMNESRLRETFEYAQRVGFSRIYLWGAEWWYWLKEKKEYPAVWEEAKKIFSQYGDRCGDCITVSLGKSFVWAKVADDEQERIQGLSQTDFLGRGSGMLFLFSVSDRYGFWMKDMQYAIDIIWMNDAKKVIYIEENVLPETYPKVFTPSVGAKYVLEVPAGWVRENAVQLGDLGRWQ